MYSIISISCVLGQPTLQAHDISGLTCCEGGGYILRVGNICGLACMEWAYMEWAYITIVWADTLQGVGNICQLTCMEQAYITMVWADTLQGWGNICGLTCVEGHILPWSGLTHSE